MEFNRKATFYIYFEVFLRITKRIRNKNIPEIITSATRIPLSLQKLL